MTNDFVATFREVFEGGAVLQEYQSAVGDTRADGMALIGQDLGTNQPCLSWVDTFHTGSNVMLFAAEACNGRDGVCLVGSYAAESETWRWRIVFTVGADELRIEHFNITPAGDEAPAVRVTCRRES